MNIQGVQQWTLSQQEQLLVSVANMLSCPLFSSSPRQQRFLNYLVAKTLAGSAGRLKGYTIAVEVFDKKDGFDPSQNAIVRVEATRLRNKLREYYDTFGKLDDVSVNFPKGSYVLELNFKKRHPTTSTPIQSQLNQTQTPYQIIDKPSLAVLPFMNIGIDNTKEYFADGVVDSLISMFSRLSGLFVISRQSSFSYKNTSKTSEQIATELGVRYLLEGSVQHAGTQVRITAQLTDTKDGGQVWSDRYDRELTDIFALEDDLTQNIVRVLQIKLAGEEAAQFGVQQTNSIVAHDCLLQGTAKHRIYTEKATVDAIVLYKRAIELDSCYAAAHAWLARALALNWSQKWSADPAILDLSYFHAERAVALDAQSSFAISILGWVQLWRQNRDDSIAQCRRAVILDPNNAEAHLFLSLVLSAAGFGDEALYYIEKAQRFNPIADAFNKFAYGLCYFVQKNYAKAISSHEQGCILNPNFKPNHFFQMIIMESLGQHVEAQEKLKTLLVLTNASLEMPNMVIWTDKTLAAQQVACWNAIKLRYLSLN